MTLLNPILAWIGLGAVAIPVVIHLLLRRRRKPVPWAAMRFLLEAYRSQRQRILLEQWLLLATRCLLVAVIALGVGRLVLGHGGGSDGPRVVYLVLDDSLTSAARSAGPEDAESASRAERSALERMRARASAVLGSLDPARGDRAALVLASGRPGIVPATPDLDAVSRAIEAAGSTPVRADWARAGSEVDRAIAESPQDAAAEVVVLSEWRAGSLMRGEALPALEADGVRVLPVAPAESESNNLWIASVEASRRVLVEGAARDPAGASRLRLTLGRAATDRAERSVPVTIEARAGVRADEPRWVVAEGVAAFERDQSEAGIDVPLDLSPVAWSDLRRDRDGSAMLVLEARLDPGIETDAIDADNTSRLLLRSRAALEVVLVAPGGLDRAASLAEFTPADWIERVLDDGGATGITVRRVSPDRVGAATLADADAIIVPDPSRIDERAADAIGSAVRRGVLLVVTPPADAAGGSWGGWIGRALELGVTPSATERSHEPPLGIDPDARRGGVLSLLRGELEPLARPVIVSRSVDLGLGDAAVVDLRLSDGSAVLQSVRPGGDGAAGLAVVLLTAIDLDWTSLPANPLVVPLLQEIVRQGVGAARPSGVAAAGQTPMTTDANPGRVELQAVDAERLPTDASGPLLATGVFAVRTPEGARVDTLVVNADVAASDTAPTDRPAVEAALSAWTGSLAWLGDESGSAAEKTGVAERELALWLFAAALVLAVLECGLARRASHAGSGGGSVREAAA